MTADTRRGRTGRNMRDRMLRRGEGGRPLRERVVVALPNGMTLGNLFFGVFAIISASRGEFWNAGLYVVLAGVCDALDGRIARATGTGSRFGAELDSLVDVVSFGVAPALIMYFAVLNRNGSDWVWCFAYIACAAFRLAVFNVEQAGKAKTHFRGLPSPAAGLTLATYYWFSQTPLYMQTNIADLPWHQMLRFLIVGLGMLMVSRVPYPAFPTVGVGSRKELFSLVIVVIGLVSLFLVPREFFFPACLAYILYGLGKTVLFGLFNLRADHVGRDMLAPADVLPDAPEPVIAHASAPRLTVSADAPLPQGTTSRRRRRRRPRGNSNRPDRNDPDTPSSPGSSGE